MAKGKIIYQNWIVEIGLDPGQIGKIEILSDKVLPNPKIVAAVREAISKLSLSEREFIERYYFQGQSYREISSDCGRKLSRIEGLHRQALARLKKNLAGFTRQQFGIESDIGRNCLICRSADRQKIDRLIMNKNERETWKKIIKILKTKFNILIKTPQVLIGHQKYHMH